MNLPLIALAIGAFAIGVTEFAPMGMLPVIATGRAECYLEGLKSLGKMLRIGRAHSPHCGSSRQMR